MDNDPYNEVVAGAIEMNPHERINVVIVDTKTGLTATMSTTAFQATENNDSCDCNRELAFDRDTGSGICLGCERYRVIEVSPMPEGYALADFNKGYPEPS